MEKIQQRNLFFFALQVVLLNIYILKFLVLFRIDTEADWAFEEYSNRLGYPVKTYKVETKDGYINIVHRIQQQDTIILDDQNDQKVLLLMHGLTCSSDVFIVNNQEIAPAFILANQGYDVWIPNSRGNRYSREHLFLFENQKEFWDFSWHEKGIYDLPAFIQLIVRETQTTKIEYLGHSQGAAIVMAALAQEQPIVKKYLNQIFLLGGVTFVSNHRSTLLQTLKEANFIQIVEKLEIYDVLNVHWFSQSISGLICQYLNFICRDIIKEISDQDPILNNLERFNIILGHYPSGSSLKNIQHWIQLTDAAAFRKFDFLDQSQNLLHYGQETPPSYCLSAIKHQIHMIVGTSDKLGTVEDNLILYNSLQNAKNKTIEFFPLGHATFIWGRRMDYLDYVMKIIQQK